MRRGANRACSDPIVPEFVWDEAKNELLLRQRGISFEDIKYCLTIRDVLDDIEHPDQERYPGQRLYIVRMNKSAWVVPYRRTTRYVFLYIAYPCEKFTRIYRDELGGGNERR